MRTKYTVWAILCPVFIVLSLVLCVFGINLELGESRVSEEEFCATHPEYVEYINDVTQNYPWLNPTGHREEFMTEVELVEAHQNDVVSTILFCISGGSLFVGCALYLLLLSGVIPLTVLGVGKRKERTDEAV